MKKLSILKNRWVIVSLVLACWALGASLTAGYYFLQYNDVVLRTGGVLVYVNIGVDYGNGTRTYYNDTKALTGETVFDVTKQVANVEYQVGSLGTYVTEINGVKSQGNFGWTFWPWNSTSQTWSFAHVGADAYSIANGETFMWYYQNGFNPPS